MPIMRIRAGLAIVRREIFRRGCGGKAVVSSHKLQNAAIDPNANLDGCSVNASHLVLEVPLDDGSPVDPPELRANC
jgi:hypothetical protein